MYSVITNYNVFVNVFCNSQKSLTPSWEAPAQIIEAIYHSTNSNGILIYKYIKVTPRRNFKDCVNWYAIVEFDKSITSIILDETSLNGVKTIL